MELEDKKKEEDDLICIVCVAQKANMTALPCNHTIVCTSCDLQLQKHIKRDKGVCLQCRQAVQSFKLVEDKSSMPKCAICKGCPANTITAPCRHSVLCVACILQQKRERHSLSCFRCHAPINAVYTLDMEYFSFV